MKVVWSDNICIHCDHNCEHVDTIMAQLIHSLVATAFAQYVIGEYCVPSTERTLVDTVHMPLFR